MKLVFLVLNYVMLIAPLFNTQLFQLLLSYMCWFDVVLPQV